MRRFDFFPKDPSYGRRRKKKRWKRYFVDDLFDLARRVFLIWVYAPYYVWIGLRNVLLSISYLFRSFLRLALLIINLNVAFKFIISKVFVIEESLRPILLDWCLPYYQFSFFHFLFGFLKICIYILKVIVSFSYLYVFIFVYDAFLLCISIYLVFLLVVLFVNVVSEFWITLKLRRFFIFSLEHREYFISTLWSGHLNIISRYVIRLMKKELAWYSWVFIIFRWIFLITPVYWVFLLVLVLLRLQALHVIFLFESIFGVKFLFLLKFVSFLDFLGKFHNSVIRFRNFDFEKFLYKAWKKNKNFFKKLYFWFWRERVYWRKFSKVVYRRIWKLIKSFYVERNFVLSFLWWLRFVFLYVYFLFLVSLDLLGLGSFYRLKIKLKCFSYFYLNFYLYPKFVIKSGIGYLNSLKTSWLAAKLKFYLMLKFYFFGLFFKVAFLKVLFDVSLFLKFFRLESFSGWFKIFCFLKIKWFYFVNKIKSFYL